MRKEFFELKNGEKAILPFSDGEFENRISKLRKVIADSGIDFVIFTSMHNIAYFSGFLYCSFGRPYALIVSNDLNITVSANIDLGQPWRRSYGQNVIYTDWKRDNYWRAVSSIVGHGKIVGIEGDHIPFQQNEKLKEFVKPKQAKDISDDIMKIRMIKSMEEMNLIRSGASIADIGGAAIIESIKPGIREIDIAMIGRDAMEKAIADRFPNSELRDTWVWFQSGINTDGAHNPVTTRTLKVGDILSLNTFPMISGYYTALERTLWVGEPDKESLRVWEANVKAHELGLSLINEGIACSAVCDQINNFLEDQDLLKYRTFGYGHSFGVLSHYYGREAGLELREDIDTILEKNMVVSMEPMLTIPQGNPGAGGYREHDIVILTEKEPENITKTPYGPAHNIIKV
jgi:creatinase